MVIITNLLDGITQDFVASFSYFPGLILISVIATLRSMSMTKSLQEHKKIDGIAFKVSFAFADAILIGLTALQSLQLPTSKVVQCVLGDQS